MDINDSKITHKRLLMDTNKLRYSVYSFKHNPFCLATVCLGVLCILLLTAVIGQSVSYQKVQQENKKKLQAVNADKDGLQKSLISVQKEKSNTEENQKQLEQNVELLTRGRGQMQRDYNSLAQEMNKVRINEGTLKSSNAALTKTLEQLHTTAAMLQNDKDALMKDNDLIQIEFNQAVQHKTTLEKNCKTVTTERNNLQNRFNNISRIKDQLQSNYNGLMMQVESLEKRLHVNAIEKDQAQSSHMNATAAKNELQELYDILAKGKEQLNSSYNILLREKQELEKRSLSIQAERDSLMEKNGNLMTERDQLHVEVTKLNETNAVETKKRQLTKERDRLTQLLKSLGWVYFGGSMYLGSTIERSWQQTRQFCQSKGADLIIINSQEEQEFAHSTFKERRWIGLSDRAQEGVFKWVDGSPLTTSFWYPGEPNDGSGVEDCGITNFKEVEMWNDAECSKGFKGICEFSFTRSQQ